ncbi:MAG TPA: GNAT family N-acetyltransferase [Polyangium sp.]|nr:GNAT family N-acetyltransferase [Polyangium sp.]
MNDTLIDTHIRLATSSDIEALARNHRSMAFETENKTLDRETTLRGTRAVLDDPGKGFYLIAERAGQMVGQLLVTFEWSDWRDGTFWWIQSVYVLPHARRTGVYRALHDYVLAKARRSKDICGVRLYVDKDNGHAQATYRAMGMLPAHYDIYEVDFILGGDAKS